MNSKVAMKIKRAIKKTPINKITFLLLFIVCNGLKFIEPADFSEIYAIIIGKNREKCSF